MPSRFPFSIVLERPPVGGPKNFNKGHPWKNRFMWPDLGILGGDLFFVLTPKFVDKIKYSRPPSSRPGYVPGGSYNNT